MNQIRPQEPNRLKIVWQSSGHDRTKYTVGEIVKSGHSLSLSYFLQSNDFESAWISGFRGHPAFDIKIPTHHSNVMEILSRRLPPKSRQDYGAYLFKHNIDVNQNLSDFAILGYTLGKLPSDGFMFPIDFKYQEMPFIFGVEVSGFRYSDGMHMDISILKNQFVSLTFDDNNIYDQNAIKVIADGTSIGFIPRYYSEDIRRWARNHSVVGFIQRIEGAFTHPEVYLTVIMQKMPTNMHRFMPRLERKSL